MTNMRGMHVIGKKMEGEENLERKETIKNVQRGSVREKIPFDQMTELFEQVTKCIDEGNVVDAVHVYFIKVFDKILHGIWPKRQEPMKSKAS